MTKITKAVFPVAGLGTRFLPATKANPKEMMPVVDKPLIQYAVEEAIEAGVTELIFVTSSSKRAIEDHFDSNYELESRLAQRDKQAMLDIVHNILPRGVTCAYVRQGEQLGLGNAVLCAKPLVNNQAFAVLLADDLIASEGKGCLLQMLSAYNDKTSAMLAVEKIPTTDTHKYGVVSFKERTNSVYRINDIVEKPAAEDAPSNLGVVGRYIFQPEIFSHLEKLSTGKDGEIQLTDAIATLIQEGKEVDALEFSGKRYDCGSKLGYLQATIAYGLQHADVGDELREYLKEFV